MTHCIEQNTPSLSPCVISSIRSLINHSNWKDSSLAAPYKTPHRHRQGEQSLMLHLNSRWTGVWNLLWLNETEMTQQKDEFRDVTRGEILICNHLISGHWFCWYATVLLQHGTGSNASVNPVCVLLWIRWEKASQYFADAFSPVHQIV